MFKQESDLHDKSVVSEGEEKKLSLKERFHEQYSIKMDVISTSSLTPHYL